MKTVGIITMHRVKNYGSALQAYALVKYCSNLGHHAEIIDYVFPNAYHLKKRMPSLSQRLKLRIREIARSVLVEFWLRRNAKFERFAREELNLSRKKYSSREKLCSNPPAYDVYMTGSDQVWNVNKIFEDDSFFCDFAPQNSRRVSFGASFTINELSKTYAQRVKSLLSNYSHIGVRESSSMSILEQLSLDKTIVKCNTCDPSLLLSANDYRQLSNKSKVVVEGDYILVHQLEYNFSAEPAISIAIAEAKKKYGCKMVLIDHMFKKVEHGDIKLCNLGPNEFVWLFEHAKAIVTSSFHGTMFSIIFRKPFVAIAPPASHSDHRIADVLFKTGLNKRLVYNEEAITIKIEDVYTAEEERMIDGYITQSKQFLISALK